MKTLIYRNAANTIRVEVKCDIFATDVELQLPGFDSRFTRMEISKGYDDVAKAKMNMREIETDWVSMQTLATATADIGLYLLGDSGEIEIVAP
jgi:hypothetical protein